MLIPSSLHTCNSLFMITFIHNWHQCRCNQHFPLLWKKCLCVYLNPFGCTASTTLNNKFLSPLLKSPLQHLQIQHWYQRMLQALSTICVILTCIFPFSPKRYSRIHQLSHRLMFKPIQGQFLMLIATWVQFNKITSFLFVKVYHVVYSGELHSITVTSWIVFKCNQVTSTSLQFYLCCLAFTKNPLISQHLWKCDGSLWYRKCLELFQNSCFCLLGFEKVIHFNNAIQHRVLGKGS